MGLGAVHKVRDAIFFANFDPPVTHPGAPSIFSRSSTKAPFINSLSIVRRGFCQGVFCLEGFVRGGFCPFPLLSEYICYNRKLNILYEIGGTAMERSANLNDEVTEGRSSVRAEEEGWIMNS